MKQFVIIEKLKEQINGRAVKAAVFYTFNFSARFFENYILTTFLPHVNFSDNEIQNAILWRKYYQELPPVTVYCDYHQKGTEAPSIDYLVQTVDMPSGKLGKPCFHPKISLLLLNDGSLIVLVGSNNLTVGGWCTNKEIMSVVELKSGVDFPYDLKKALEGFVVENQNRIGVEPSESEGHILDFFRQRKHTDNNEISFFSSANSNFKALLQQLLNQAGDDRFLEAEVISPYMPKDSGLLSDLETYVPIDQVKIHTPYKSTVEADITEELYQEFATRGVKWAKFKEPDKEKGFRFNHSKCYRLRGNHVSYTIIGSVNFTKSAWAGKLAGGNAEAALIVKEPADSWASWLVPHTDERLVFVTEPGDEAASETRYDVPVLRFILNWSAGSLEYSNPVKQNFSGKLLFSHRNIVMQTGKQHLKLDPEILSELASDALIRVKQFHTGREFFFFPVQMGLENKPLPLKLRLSDNELLKLWENVSIKEQAKSEIADLIERFIMDRQDQEGDISKERGQEKSTLNMMSSHISALLHLEERIFPVPQLKRDYIRAKELLDYYLFANNIDTLSGYRNLLKEMDKDGVLLKSFYWFALNLIKARFYDLKRIRRFYREMEFDSSGLKKKVDQVKELLDKEIARLQRELKKERVSNEMLTWIKSKI